MIYTTYSLAAAFYLDSFFGPVTDPTTVFGMGLALAALVVLFTSARKVPQADLPLPSAATAVASLLLLGIMLVGLR